MFVKHLGGKLRGPSASLKNPFRISEMLRGEGRENYGVEQRMCLVMNKDGKIISANEFCANQLGYSVKELTGKSIDKVIYSKDRNRIKGYLVDYISNLSQGLIHDFLMFDKRGNTFLAKCTFTLRKIRCSEGFCSWFPSDDQIPVVPVRLFNCLMA